MEVQTFWLFVTILTVVVFGSLSSIVYFITNSPGRRSAAEIEKLRKLKQLNLLERYENNKKVDDKILKFQQRLDEHQQQLDHLVEENDFLKRLLEKKR